MLTPNVALLLRRAQRNSKLADDVRRASSYQALVELSEQTGDPAPADDWRAAFAARNARVLTLQMIRHGVMEPVRLAPVPPMDHDLWERVTAMDLSPVVEQLVMYKGWDPERAADAEHRYRRFFYLKAVMPQGKASPSPEVDEFWHQHIINTQQYGSDCECVAGRFIHHIFLSPDDPAQARELSAVWLSTVTCYESLFDEPYEETLGTALLERWPQA